MSKLVELVVVKLFMQHINSNILITLMNVHTKLVNPLKLPYCKNKIDLSLP